jgi:4-hydroxy-3-methylbut-2-enyl diphosphate reductase
MAIESLDRAIERFGTPIYVYHEIVHNKWVVNRFRALGAVFVDSLDDVPPGAHVLYSAHGVSPHIRRQAASRNLHAIDATCPLVTKVHREAVRFASDGYTIVLIGHAGHDEVVGTTGEAPDAIRLVGSVDQADCVEVADPDRVAYLTQTTLSVDDAAEIVRRLQLRFPKLAGPSRADICYATQNRQEAVRQLAAQADVVLVVGSQNSSNSQRLAELARAHGIPAYLIDGPADIEPDWFRGDETIVITAGASAPEDLVQQCVNLLQDRYHACLEQTKIRDEDVRFMLPRELR